MPRVRSELPVKGLCGRGQLLETHLASGGRKRGWSSWQVVSVSGERLT